MKYEFTWCLRRLVGLICGNARARARDQRKLVPTSYSAQPGDLLTQDDRNIVSYIIK